MELLFMYKKSILIPDFIPFFIPNKHYFLSGILVQIPVCLMHFSSKKGGQK